MDLLGVRALTVLSDAAELVRRDSDPVFRLTEIPLDDRRRRHCWRGVTRLASSSAIPRARGALCASLRAQTIADLAIANAFFKPGPATGGMAEAFVRRYRGEERVTYLHPALKPILEPTRGVLIFRGQILRVATEIAGLSWAQADHLRRGMSKMNPEAMAQMQRDFEAGCQRPPPDGPGLSAEQARRLWQQVEVFAGYGFNQGHATAYADVSLPFGLPQDALAGRFFLRSPAGLGLSPSGGLHGGGRALGRCSASAARERERRAAGARLGRWAPRDLVGPAADFRFTGAFAGGAADGAPGRSLSRTCGMCWRVFLQELEMLHLIPEPGALDGLGSSRAALPAGCARLSVAGAARANCRSWRWKATSRRRRWRSVWRGSAR